ncbi:hypothetical protein P152DRAFT_510104 [Eremomyces bilateralis CBS 781.70]|uniref:Uncharacterized protein n=1 Tax=Eremomyces bilateralis CBS 781.70 TaxID=1392243 RepID=A0A6G1FQD3_9PEZI|nr:uncharacterized protein P152DRAFT_510104 [Eremomyces bilateralis CBS 781.70]KAF1807938.1 hypothetical protein P152DRAFT_510104 [Eremomyces bilateralis CBS 781.70]
MTEPKPLVSLKDTNVSQPQLLHQISNHSIAASEDYFSLADTSSSTGDRDGAFDPDATPQRTIIYNTPPSQYITPETSDEKKRAAAAQQDPHTVRLLTTGDGQVHNIVTSFGSPHTRANTKEVRRKPALSSHSDGSQTQERGGADDLKALEAGLPTHPALAGGNKEKAMDPYSPATTPGVDTSPFIRFAIDQITRDEEVSRASRQYPGLPGQSSGTPGRATAVDVPEGAFTPSEESFHTPPLGDGHAAAFGHTRASSEILGPSHHLPPKTEPIYPDPPSPYHGPHGSSRPESSPARRLTDIFAPFQPTRDSAEHPPLRFIPSILRPIWLILYMIILVGLIFVLILSAVYSFSTRKNPGILDYQDFGDSRYFLFRYLPTLVGMLLLIWVMQIDIALTRISPFIALSSPSRKARTKAVFLDLAAKQFLIPSRAFRQFRAGQPVLGVCMILLWLQIFTIPLLASSYNVKFFGPVDGGVWRWVAAQIVVWVVVGLYVLQLLALVLIAAGLWPARAATGLRWDPRSLADIAAMLERANIMSDYADSETFATTQEFHKRLWNRTDRLGYWYTSQRPGDVFYGIGEEGGPTRRYSVERGRILEKSTPSDIPAGSHRDIEAGYSIRSDIRSLDIRRRYLPWFLRDTFAVAWFVIAFVLLIAFLVVSFVNNATMKGFLPMLPALADDAGFSAPNFLYAFIPALLGLILFLTFQAIDLHIRALQPYASLSSSNGATADRSLLVDYVHRFPLSATLAAAANGHVLPAYTSFITLLNLAIPVLASGLLWAQFHPSTPSSRASIPAPAFTSTSIPPHSLLPRQSALSGTTLISAHPPALYALCAFLSLHALPYFILLLTPRHKSLSLPHRSSSLAETISWLYMSPMVSDAAFARCASKADLVTRMLGRQRVVVQRSGFLGSVASLVGGGGRVGEEVRVKSGKSLAVPEPRGDVEKGVAGVGGPAMYGFGVYLGRDGKEHLGVDRVRRGEGRGEMVLFDDVKVVQKGKRVSWVL